MTQTICYTLWEVFLAVMADAKQNGGEIVAADDPRTLLIGWCCTKTDNCYRVRLADIKMRKATCIPNRPEQAEDLLTKLITTIDGRKQFTMMLNIGFTTPDEMLQSYERLGKLKAFW